MMMSGRFHLDVLELHRKYGSVVRVAPDELLYSDAVIWNEAYANRSGREEFPRSTIIDNVNGAKDIISANDTDHTRFRALLSRAFSDTSLRKQEKNILSHVDLCISQLHADSMQKDAVDLVRWFSFAVFDIVGDLSFGKSFGCLESGRLHTWIESTFGSLKTIIYFDVFRDYGLMPLFSLLMPKSLQKARLENFRFASSAVKTRMQQGGSRGDFLDAILGSGNSERQLDQESDISFGELVNNCSILVAAGSLNMAALLPGCINLLLRNPKVHDKVTIEIRNRYRSSSEIDMLSVNNGLPYLLAVLNETMRLYPPNPTLPPRTVPRGGATVNGVLLPEGAHVQLVPYAAYRLESNFKRPTDFVPERWLGDSEFASDKREVFKPFSVGSRNCLGQNLAIAEMRLIIAKFLWHFDVRFSPKMEKRDWIAEQETYLLWEKVPLWVDISARV
ncbi:MAG: hypothetical protein Q9160_000644 [Pyrenula sp. 1 TL-2023]